MIVKKWKVGLIGTGWWSDKHLQAWSRIEGVEITCLCNRSPSKLKKKAQQYNIAEENLFDNIDKMLEYGDFDILDIVTGPETHLEFVCKASKYGKHIMCQKPFALSVEDAEIMVKNADENGVRLMVTENWRWLEPYQTIKKVLDDGTIGKLYTARYTHADYYTPRMSPETELPQPFFRDMPKLLFYEMGTHWFDTWRFLFGTPKRLYAEFNTVSPYIKGEDSGIVVLSYDDGFYGFMDMSWATRHIISAPLDINVGPLNVEQLSIDGEEGTLKLYSDGRITVINKNITEEIIIAEKTTLDHDESHFRLQSHFIDCLNTGKSFQTSGADNVVSLKMVFDTYESAKNHIPVNMSK